MRGHVDTDVNPADSNERDEIGEYGVNDSVDKAVSNCGIYKIIEDFSSILREIEIADQLNGFDGFHYFRNFADVQVYGAVFQHC